MLVINCRTNVSTPLINDGIIACFLVRQHQQKNGNILPFHSTVLEVSPISVVQKDVLRVAEGSVVDFYDKGILEAVVIPDGNIALTDNLGLNAGEATGEWFRGCAGGINGRGIAEGPLDRGHLC